MASPSIGAGGGSRDLCDPRCNHHPSRPLRRAVRSWLFRQEFADRVCRGADPDWRDDARERVKKSVTGIPVAGPAWEVRL
jgi:hypothetical protein